MTPNEIRIAIAEACGWTDVKMGQPWMLEFPEDFPNIPCGIRPEREDRKGPRRWGPVPDYLNDLNAMREAEVWLKNDDAHAFACYTSDLFEEHGSDVIHLSAAQRAEAFLKTLSLWKS